jgi:N-acetylmuramoyl-L-alanine amidase
LTDMLKYLPASAMLLVLLGACAAVASPAAQCRETFSVALDVGHSRKAPGAISARGRGEYDFNFDLAGSIAETLKAGGFKKVHVIVSDGFGDLKSLMRRVEDSTKLQPNLFVSIHHDSVQPRYLKPWVHNGAKRFYTEDKSGFSLYVSRKNPQAEASLAFARLVSDRLTAQGLRFTKHHAEPIPGEGREWADEGRGIHFFDELIVLREHRLPAVLFEAGVILNRDDELVLMTEQRRKIVAAAFAGAVERFCAGPEPVPVAQEPARGAQEPAPVPAEPTGAPQ